MVRQSMILGMMGLLCALPGCKNPYRDAVTETVKQSHWGELQECGRELEARTPGQHGVVTVAIEVQPDGKVSRTGFGKGDDVKDEAMRECIRQKSLNWQLPANTSGNPELIEIQFKL